MRLTIHQPEHAPWLGLFDKIRKSDLLVILDTVQFKKNDFQNRNKLRSGWITVPVKKHPLDTDIKDIEIASVEWKNQYLSRFKTYQFESRYGTYFPAIETMIQSSRQSLSELNIMMLLFMMQCFDIRTPTVRASSLGLPKVKGGNEVVLQICGRFHSTRESLTYISGTGGKNYLQVGDFEKKRIAVEFNDAQYPHLSAFDHLLKHGPSF